MKLTKEECSQIINQAENGTWNVVDEYKTRYSSQHYTTLPTSVKVKLKAYCISNLNIVVHRFRQITLLKYDVGDKFARHVDHRQGHPHTFDRVYNFNVRLNDDYEGGVFYLEGKPIIKEVGEIYNYRSSQYHKVDPVTKGVRYLLASFLHQEDFTRLDKYDKDINKTYLI